MPNISSHNSYQNNEQYKIPQNFSHIKQNKPNHNQHSLTNSLNKKSSNNFNYPHPTLIHPIINKI